MTQETPNGEPLAFSIIGEPRKLTLEEVIEHFGDPAANVHPEENRDAVIELVTVTGQRYAVRLGLPEATVGAYGAVKQYEPPYEPHVFTSDRFILRSEADPNHLLVDESGLHILHMHGRWNGKAWVPADWRLEQKGVTIPDLLASFERTTGTSVDVVWTCQADAEYAPHKLEVATGHPYIYPLSGYAQGIVGLERGLLTVSLNEAPDMHSQVEYQEWLAAHPETV